jgi:hypothetical protein
MAWNFRYTDVETPLELGHPHGEEHPHGVGLLQVEGVLQGEAWPGIPGMCGNCPFMVGHAQFIERNTLMEWVYPKIKEYCKERHGLEFQVCLC